MNTSAIRNYTFLKYRPPRIAMLLIAVAAMTDLLVPTQPELLLSSAAIAILLAVSGFSVMIWAWWQFRQHKVAICPTDETDHLITDGIYRLTRNPMYLGMILMLGGIAFFFGTVPFFLMTIVYFVIINWTFCAYEEDKLAAAFGEEYANYKSRVRRWI